MRTRGRRNGVFFSFRFKSDGRNNGREKARSSEFSSRQRPLKARFSTSVGRARDSACSLTCNGPFFNGKEMQFLKEKKKVKPLI